MRKYILPSNFFCSQAESTPAQVISPLVEKGLAARGAVSAKPQSASHKLWRKSTGLNTNKGVFVVKMLFIMLNTLAKLGLYFARQQHFPALYF
jgi:hypothetical protein